MCNICSVLMLLYWNHFVTQRKCECKSAVSDQMQCYIKVYLKFKKTHRVLKPYVELLSLSLINVFMSFQVRRRHLLQQVKSSEITLKFGWVCWQGYQWVASWNVKYLKVQTKKMKNLNIFYSTITFPLKGNICNGMI